MIAINQSDFQNDSYTFFGPMEMTIFENGDSLKESMVVKLCLSVFYVICMILSLIGNVCTCAVISRDRTMRTPTNCYLVNLAVTDMLTALFVPIDIYILWIPDLYPFGEVGCRLHFILWDCLSSCSVLTISAFTVERYLVISKPFLRQKLLLKTRVFKIILINWLIACSFCFPDVFYIDLLERKAYAYCFVKLSDAMKVFLAIEVVVFFVIPMTIISVMYILIALKLKKSHLELRNSPVSIRKNRVRAVKMLAAVAAMFFLCWAPFAVTRILMITPKYNDDEYYDFWRVLNYVCGVNVYMSTAVNPILYSLMSHKFRQAFKDFLKGKDSTTRSRIEKTLSSTIQCSEYGNLKLYKTNQ